MYCMCMRRGRGRVAHPVAVAVDERAPHLRPRAQHRRIRVGIRAVDGVVDHGRVDLVLLRTGETASAPPN
jgi:hypothetical protein